MTSPKKAAIELAQYGRAGDSTLMHVSTDEVKALRGYARSIGRDVTTNPDTGLPEAFSFGDIAKIAALAGATYLTGGALAPYTTAALGSTLGGVAANGLAGAGISKLVNPEMSTEQALLNGAGSAVMGAGIGGLGGKIAEFGAEPAAAAAMGAGSAGAGAGAAGAGAAGAGAAGAGATAGAAPTMDAFGANMIQPGIDIGAAAPTMDAYGMNAISPGSAPMDTTGPYNTFAGGSERAMQDPGKFFADMNRQGGLGDAAKIGIGASMINLDTPGGEDDGDISGSYNVYEVQGSPIINRSGSKEDTYGKARTVKFAEGRLVDPMARDGDGVSDGTEAMINGRRPAALASGEYVFPSRAVSAAGNGSTMAGAKRLDAMSNDLIRQQHRAGLSRAPKMDINKARKKARV